jgi:hypothetical protein
MLMILPTSPLPDPHSTGCAIFALEDRATARETEVEELLPLSGFTRFETGDATKCVDPLPRQPHSRRPGQKPPM